MIRVLSDLHLGHPASLVKHVEQIEPLFEGARAVVFNGDTIELRLKRVRSASLRHLEELKARCASRGIEPIVINGNHDPDASKLNHLELMDGRTLVTHGHVLFPAITPWGADAGLLLETNLRILDEIAGDGEHSLEDRLQAVRQACIETPGGKGMPATRLQWLVNALSEVAHPSRPLAVLRAWISGPGLASDFVAKHRPRVQCVLFGHTHFAGSWMRGGRLVVNTGAFMPWFGRRLVEISGDVVRVRAVARDGEVFRPGRELSRWSPAPVASVAEAEEGARVRFGRG